MSKGETCMLLGYNTQRIADISYDFYNVTGIYFMIYDENFVPLNNQYKINNAYCDLVQSRDDGKQGCWCSDNTLLQKCKETGQPQAHICHAGLIDMVVPITHENKIIGYIMFGKLKSDTDFSLWKDRMPFDVPFTDKLEALYGELPLFTDDKLNSATNLLTILAKHLLSENIITPQNSEMIKRVVTYIDNNLCKKLTIEDITSSVNISPSSLYSIFHTYFNSTVSEYINKKRVHISKAMLMNIDLSIETISEQLGFSSTAYYSKMFKKIYGVSPLKFRQYQNNLTTFSLYQKE